MYSAQSGGAFNTNTFHREIPRTTISFSPKELVRFTIEKKKKGHKIEFIKLITNKRMN